ncbi:MAG: bifunctional oligoribonuclease/PAP phosphatase NrnA [Planctomycetia bacterium]|nr:MAG: bifunctional oligoribonuclease/PAP phosphatase NrnA [Planctomycetia bacterium]
MYSGENEVRVAMGADMRCEPPAGVLELLRGARRVGLVAHVTPDADCIGSMGALWHALRARGAEVTVFTAAGSVSRRMGWLAEFCSVPLASDAAVESCDLIVALDTARERRVNVEGGWDRLSGRALLNVDHHPTNTRFGTACWIEPAASSTCELVFELIAALPGEITADIATLLYAGIHADTQGFSLSNTTARSLRVAHELAVGGARIAELCERLHRANSRQEFELLKQIYSNTRVSADGRLAWSRASLAEIEASGCTVNDVEDQVDVPRSIDGIDVAILLTEGIPGKVRVNFRGEGDVNVLELAQQFGGGGHVARAGAMISGSLDEVAERVVRAAEEFVRRRRG